MLRGMDESRTNSPDPTPLDAPPAGLPAQAGVDRQILQALLDCGQGVAALLESHERLTERLATLERDVAQSTWVDELRYRDLLQLVGELAPPAPPLSVRLHTEHPLAIDSPDHVHPLGAALGNTRAPWFVARCEQLMGRKLSVLDIGCSGGGMVLDFSLRGHRAVGLEGSDYSLRRLRAEWRLLGDRLFTCDVTHPFEVEDLERHERMTFDLVTAWDVMEHFPEQGLPQVFANVATHLKPGGLFIGSLSTRHSTRAPDGSRYHQTVRDRAWWTRFFADQGLPLWGDHPFDHVDFARGNGASPRSPADFAAAPDTGFHFVARR